MIRSFLCVDTEALFASKAVPRFRNIERVARRKLLQLHATTDLTSLRVPPGNQLEALKGNRRGNTVSGLTNNGESVLCGMTTAPTKLKSWTTTRS